MALGMEVESIPLHQAGVSMVNRADEAETVLWSGSAYAIGRVIQTPDPDVILFSVVPGLEAWLQAIESGTTSPVDPVTNYFAVQLFHLRVNDGAVTLLDDNLAQVTLNLARFQ